MSFRHKESFSLIRVSSDDAQWTQRGENAIRTFFRPEKLLGTCTEKFVIWEIAIEKCFVMEEERESKKVGNLLYWAEFFFCSWKLLSMIADVTSHPNPSFDG